MFSANEQVWLIDPRFLTDKLIAEVSAMAASSSIALSKVMRVEDGVAIISIHGTMLPELYDHPEVASVPLIREAFLEAVESELVETIVLDINSPGGVVTGVPDLAATIAGAAGTKPIIAQVSGMAASAAYWVAAQADEINAGIMDVVGSIGARMSFVDVSEAFEKQGIKVVQVASGEFKGAGAFGQEITESQIEYFQSLIDDVHESFVEAVASGRGASVSTVQPYADGRVFYSSNAVQIGLIDREMNLSQTLETVARSTISDEVIQMSDKSPATIAELQSHLVGASNDFIVEQLSANATLDQAREAFIVHQQLQIEESRNRATALEAERDKAKAEAVAGVDPVSAGTTSGSGSEEDECTFKKRFQARLDRGMSRRAAMRATVNEDPQDHQRYLELHAVQTEDLKRERASRQVSR